MISKMRDLQCAWIMLSMSAVPRANHMIRMVPPSLVRGYTLAHDNAIWNCFCKLFEVETFSGDLLARNVASMPSRLGGLGLRSAERSSRGAFMASWAGALSVLDKKLPFLAERIVVSMETNSIYGILMEAYTLRND